MTGKWPDFRVTHDKFWQQLERRNVEEVCRASGAEPGGEGCYRLSLAGECCVVDTAEWTVKTDAGEPAPFEAAVVALIYLAMAKPVTPAGEWVSARSLPMGEAFFRGVHEMPVGPLAALVDEDPVGLRRAVEALGGRWCENRDVAFEADALPMVPLRFHLWHGDEEFDAECRVLLDRTADSFLLLDGILALVKITVKRLAALAEEERGSGE